MSLRVTPQRDRRWVAEGWGDRGIAELLLSPLSEQAKPFPKSSPSGESGSRFSLSEFNENQQRESKVDLVAVFWCFVN